MTISASSRTVSAHQASPVTNSASRNHYQSASSPRGGSAISDLLAADLGSRRFSLSDLGSPRGGSRISDLRSLSEPLLGSRRFSLSDLGSPRGGSRISSRRISDLGSQISLRTTGEPDVTATHFGNSHWWTLGSRFRWNRRRKKSSSSLLSISPAGFWSRVFS